MQTTAEAIQSASALASRMRQFGQWVEPDLATRFGGHLRCEVCGKRQALGDAGHHLRHGWPEHCGYTMMWWTQRQIDAGEMPAKPTQMP